MAVPGASQEKAQAGSQFERKSDACYKAIRRMIVEFQLEPGSFIDKSALCVELDVSRQPVTTALTRLEREGLVEILPQRGSYVSRLSLAGIVESMNVRAALEQFVVGRLTHRVTPALIDQLSETASRHAEAAGTQDVAAQVETDAAFHRSIAEASALPRLVEQVEIGLAAMMRVKRALREPTVVRSEVDEHLAIVSALRQEDGGRAADIMTGHILGFVERIKAFSHQRPELFVQ